LLHPVQSTFKTVTFTGLDSACESNTFVSKFSASGALAYSTYYSGGCDKATAIAVDNAGLWSYGDAFVAGTTESPSFPTTPGAFQTTLGGPANGSVGNAFAFRILGHVTFSAFSPTLTISNNDTAFSEQGSFTLGSTSNGINPLTDVVKLRVGNWYASLPARSLFLDGSGSYSYSNCITLSDNSLHCVKVQITPSGGNTYQFSVSASGVNLAGTTNPVFVEVLVGDDIGATNVTAQFQ